MDIQGKALHDWLVMSIAALLKDYETGSISGNDLGLKLTEIINTYNGVKYGN